MIHIPILFNDDPAQIVGVGKLSESAVEMTISIQNQTFLQQIRGLAQDGLLESMGLSYSASRPVTPRLEQTDLVVYRRDRFTARCCVCGLDIDLLDAEATEKVRSHAKEHGASDIMLEEKFSLPASQHPL